ncbi:MAG: haloacid dehalogenase-like hydrolase [Candidatus Pacebacteria bacterium]|nr:haloacid dehalogenase-like hydrolase [Candidatus Paceibacterota bacterium]
MKLRHLKLLVLSTVASLAILGSTVVRAETELKNWPPEAAAKLNEMIKKNANKGEYAVFDMDQTSYQWDVEESLILYMEQKGALNRNQIDKSLILTPFKDDPKQNYKESFYCYYNRLDVVNQMISYPWAAQVFAGLKVKDIKKHVDMMLAEGKPMTDKCWDGDKLVEHTVHVPNIYKGMNELYNKLTENGIRVYVMTASYEELVRAVASDPKYGYNAKPENIIGVGLLLRDANGNLTSARFDIENGVKYDAARQAAIQEMTITPYLIAPYTWFEGKYSSMLRHIDQWRKAVLIAGDTTKSDGYMMQHGVDTDKGGIRVWVNRSDRHTTNTINWYNKSAASQKELGLPVTADKNWIVVKPNELGPKIVNPDNLVGDKYNNPPKS